MLDGDISISKRMIRSAQPVEAALQEDMKKQQLTERKKLLAMRHTYLPKHGGRVRRGF